MCCASIIVGHGPEEENSLWDTIILPLNFHFITKIVWKLKMCLVLFSASCFSSCKKKKTEKIYLAGLFFISKLRIYKAEDFVQSSAREKKFYSPSLSTHSLPIPFFIISLVFLWCSSTLSIFSFSTVFVCWESTCSTFFREHTLEKLTRVGLSVDCPP